MSSSSEELSAFAAAKVAGVGHKVLVRAHARGELPATVIGEPGTTGCRYRFKLADLEAFGEKRAAACVNTRPPRSEETRRKIGASQPNRKHEPGTGVCEVCGAELPIRGYDVAIGKTRRACSKQCGMLWNRKHAPEKFARDLSDRDDVIHAGHEDARGKVAGLKPERGLMDTAELIASLPPELKRSPAAVSGHIRRGVLKPERDLPRYAALGPNLFTRGARDEYVEWLQTHPDGRLGRFARPRFRGSWYLARHRSRSEFGRMAKVLASEKGIKVGRPRELDARMERRIREAASKGHSQRQIAQNLGLSRTQVQRFLTS